MRVGCWPWRRAVGFSINEADLAVTGSNGIAALDSSVQSPQDVYVEADGAMYRVKTRASGRSQRTFGSPGDAAKVISR